MSKSRRSAEKESFWRLATEEHRKSGLSVRDFCSQEGLSTASFYAWKRSLRERDAQSSSSVDGEAELIRVEVVESAEKLPAGAQAAAAPLEVITPGGFALRFPANIDPRQLDVVLGVVAHSRGASSC